MMVKRGVVMSDHSSQRSRSPTSPRSQSEEWYSNYHSHYEKSSQLSSENPTKDLVDLTKKRNGQRPEHQMFFLLVFLRIKQVVNKLGSL